MNGIKRTFGFIHAHPLAGKHLFLAYFKFFKWQLQSRLSNKVHTVKWLEGVKVRAKKGWTGITGNFYTGLHEFEEMGFLLHFLSEGDLFLDVGANVGSYTLLAAGVKKVRCVCFEPVPTTFEKLRDNIALNGLSAIVTCMQVAIGAARGHIQFTKNEDTTNHAIIGKTPEDTVSVPVMRLDEFSYLGPSLIKIDVEGFETEVINGAQSLLGQSTLQAMIIELNGSGKRYGYNDDAIHSLLLEAGFNCYRYDPFTRRLELLNSFGNFNTIYVRDITGVKAKLRQATPFSVFGEHI